MTTPQKRPQPTNKPPARPAEVAARKLHNKKLYEQIETMKLFPTNLSKLIVEYEYLNENEHENENSNTPGSLVCKKTLAF